MTNNTYKGWDIGPDWFMGWTAVHPDYDPTPLYADDGPSDHRHVWGCTKEECEAEVDIWIEENS